MTAQNRYSGTFRILHECHQELISPTITRARCAHLGDFLDGIPYNYPFAVGMRATQEHLVLVQKRCEVVNNTRWEQEEMMDAIRGEKFDYAR